MLGLPNIGCRDVEDGRVDVLLAGGEFAWRALSKRFRRAPSREECLKYGRGMESWSDNYSMTIRGYAALVALGTRSKKTKKPAPVPGSIKFRNPLTVDDPVDLARMCFGGDHGGVVDSNHRAAALQARLEFHQKQGDDLKVHALKRGIPCVFKHFNSLEAAVAASRQMNDDRELQVPGQCSGV